jgi:hypothetical protein
MTQRFRRWQQRSSLTLAFLLVVSPLFATITRADGPDHPPAPASATDENNPAVALSQILRLERVEVPGGAELITVQAKLAGLESDNNDKWIPLVSILRDTLGDDTVENNRLRLAADLHAPVVEATNGRRNSLLLRTRRQ